MAGRKKETKSQMVMVDAYKLGQALKATLEGMALVFDAIGTDAGLGCLAKKDQTDGKDIQRGTEPTENAGNAQANGAPDGQPEEPADDAGLLRGGRTDSVDTGETDKDTEDASGKASAITLDDVTKIIVQKIKKNRSNNEKIGQILKAYGVAKVGELSDTKYEETRILESTRREDELSDPEPGDVIAESLAADGYVSFLDGGEDRIVENSGVRWSGERKVRMELEALLQRQGGIIKPEYTKALLKCLDMQMYVFTSNDLMELMGNSEARINKLTCGMREKGLLETVGRHNNYGVYMFSAGKTGLSESDYTVDRKSVV